MKIKVYLVDDHAMVRRGLAAVIGAEADLEFCGEAKDGATAIGAISQLQPDVVVVDIALPGTDGIELIKNLRSMDARIEFVVLSSHDESVYALRALKAGAKGYVMKKESAEKVIEAIRRVSGGQIYVSETVSRQMVDRLVGGEKSLNNSPEDPLSDRELEIVTLLGSGLATREIATRLHLSVKTIETHRANIKTKLNLGNASQLVQFSVRLVEERKRRETSDVA